MPIPSELSPAHLAMRLLLPERGIRNTLRNRKWLAICELLSDNIASSQEHAEELAWQILRCVEQTK